MNKKRLWFFLMAGLIFLTGGCENAQEKPFLEILPESINLQPGENRNFIALFSDTGQPANTVAWSVNGAPGGDDIYGQITANGDYTAPASFPNSDRIFIQASAGGADNGGATVFLTTFDANQRVNDDVSEASSHLDTRSANQNNLAVLGDNVYIVWSDSRNGNDDIYLSRSTDAGITFGNPVQVNSEASGDQVHPSLAVNPANGEIYVVWEDAFSTFDRDIYFAKSTDGGATFLPRVLVNTDTSDQALPTITVTPDGSAIYVAWEDNQDVDHHNSDICLSASTDGGTTFEPKLLVAGLNVLGELRSPTLFTNSLGNASLVWEDHTSFYATLQLSRISRDMNGDLEKTPPVSIVSDANTSQVHPSVAVDENDFIYLVWERAVIQMNSQTQEIIPIRYDIYLTISSDGGVTFSDPVPVNQTAATGFYGGWAYPDIIADPANSPERNIYIVWEDSRNGFLARDIYYTKSMDGGSSFETARKVNDDSADPDTFHEKPSIGVIFDTVSNTGKGVVVWTDYRNTSSANCNPCDNDLYFSREP